MEKTKTNDSLDDIQVVHTLGTVRLRHHDTNEIILVPAPSNDPNDPLNWSKGFRYYIAFVVCLAMIMCNFLAAGPTVAIVEIAESYFGPDKKTLNAHIAKVAYFFTSTALLQGMGMLFWMPVVVKYGRRPVYIISFTCYTITAIWAGVAKQYANEVAARVLMGVFAGAGESLAPLTIADIFFLHERGAIMACYTAALSCGVSLGSIIDGLITLHHPWRYIYYVATALIGGTTLLMFFTMPETSFNRSPVDVPSQLNAESKAFTKGADDGIAGDVTYVEDGGEQDVLPKKRTYLQNLKLFHGKLTKEPLLKMAMRPIVLLVIPPILWATLVMSVTIGFLVAVNSNFASAFADVYGFEPWQSGLCFISGLIGSIIGIFFGGHISDYIANYFTRRNGGIREPEMRLPAVTIGLIMSPLALVLYGVGIQNKLHWMVPTLAFAFLSFAIAQATNVSLVYIVDAYRPIAGEAVVTQLAFKAAFGFLLSFYTNPWIDEAGYAPAFGAMAGISGGVLLMWVPFYIWGKRIRHATLSWPIIRSVAWDLDREVGE